MSIRRPISISLVVMSLLVSYVARADDFVISDYPLAALPSELQSRQLLATDGEGKVLASFQNTTGDSFDPEFVRYADGGTTATRLGKPALYDQNEMSIQGYLDRGTSRVFILARNFSATPATNLLFSTIDGTDWTTASLTDLGEISALGPDGSGRFVVQTYGENGTGTVRWLTPAGQTSKQIDVTPGVQPLFIDQTDGTVGVWEQSLTGDGASGRLLLYTLDSTTTVSGLSSAPFAKRGQSIALAVYESTSTVVEFGSLTAGTYTTKYRLPASKSLSFVGDSGTAIDGANVLYLGDFRTDFTLRGVRPEGTSFLFECGFPYDRLPIESTYLIGSLSTGLLIEASERSGRSSTPPRPLLIAPAAAPSGRSYCTEPVLRVLDECKPLIRNSSPGSYTATKKLPEQCVFSVNLRSLESGKIVPSSTEASQSQSSGGRIAGTRKVKAGKGTELTVPIKGRQPTIFLNAKPKDKELRPSSASVFTKPISGVR